MPALSDQDLNAALASLTSQLQAALATGASLQRPAVGPHPGLDALTANLDDVLQRAHQQIAEVTRSRDELEAQIDELSSLLLLVVDGAGESSLNDWLVQHGAKDSGAVSRLASVLWGSVRRSLEAGSETPLELTATPSTPHTESDVLNALKEGRVEAWFQPVVRSRLRDVTGFEALIRIRTETGELVAPEEFIPQVENTPLIVPLTETVLKQALTQLRAWIDQGLVQPSTFVAINLSSAHLLNDQLVPMIADSLSECGMPGSALELEVTETALIEQVRVASERLQMLRVLGCKVAIDDFGTGYSSLEYVQRLPLDVIKLDRSFVQEVEISRIPLAIARMVCDLAKLLELEVVAEGVETLAQAELLESVGVNMLQGYWIHAPETAEVMTQWLGSEEVRLFERILR